MGCTTSSPLGWSLFSGSMLNFGGEGQSLHPESSTCHVFQCTKGTDEDVCLWGDFAQGLTSTCHGHDILWLENNLQQTGGERGPPRIIRLNKRYVCIWHTHIYISYIIDSICIYKYISHTVYINIYHHSWSSQATASWRLSLLFTTTRHVTEWCSNPWSRGVAWIKLPDVTDP